MNNANDILYVAHSPSVIHSPGPSEERRGGEEAGSQVFNKSCDSTWHDFAINFLFMMQS